MPNRIIREGLLDSEHVDELTWPAECFYHRLLLKADDHGRYTANIKLLRANLYPLKLEKVRETDVHRWLAECKDARLVRLYSAHEKPYLVIYRFKQRLRVDSKYPDPPPEEDDGILLTNDGLGEAVVGGEVSCKALVRSVKPEPNPPPPESSASTNGKPASKPRLHLADSEFVMALKLNPAYAGIDVDREIGKLKAWLLTPRGMGKSMTRQRLVNWLNRADQSMGAVQPQKKEIKMTQEEKDKYAKLNELIAQFPESIEEIKRLGISEFTYVFQGLTVDQKNELNGLKLKEKV